MNTKKLEEAIEEAKNYFTNEEESEVMNQNDSDLNFDVGFYKGLLEAQLIQSNSNNQNNYNEKAKDILWEYISDEDINEIEQRLSKIEVSQWIKITMRRMIIY